MSFKENSFGQADYDDELQNNEQQISFEADGEYPSETNIIQDDPEIFYKQKIIIEEIKFQIKNLCNIINSKYTSEKLKIFLEIKNYSNHCKTNRLKAELIYNKLIFSLKTFFKFYSKNENFQRVKTFLKWRHISFSVSKINKYKLELESSLEERVENKVNFYELRVKEKENELNELRSNMIKYVELESMLIKKIKSFEEKENNFLLLLKQIEVDKTTLEEELKTIKKTSSDRNDCEKSLETKIKEYEIKILSLNEENKEKDYSISLFLREMNELLQAHEKNIDFLSLDKDNLEENKLGVAKISTKAFNRKAVQDVSNNVNNINQFSGVSQPIHSSHPNFKNLNIMNPYKQTVSLNSLSGLNSPNRVYNPSQNNIGVSSRANSKGNISLTSSLNFANKRK